MPIRFRDLIAHVPPEVEKRVRHVRDQTRSVLRDALRAGKRVKPEVGTGSVRGVGSSPHKGKAEILKAEKLKWGVKRDA